MVSHGKHETFILMLASGQRPRYRDDIIRVMALPTGGRTQFRYRKQYVPDDLFRELSNNPLRKSKALVAYLDTSNKDRAPEIVPCRFCQVVDSEAEGEFVVIRFEVRDFAVVDQGATVWDAVIKLLPNGASLPQWEDGNLRGHFLVALESCPDAFQCDQNPLAWQAVVAKLAKRAGFHNNCPFFYYLRNIVEEGTETSAKLSNGKYALKPDKIYRADVAHYTPPSRTTGQQDGAWGRLEVSVQGNGVQSLTTQPLVIDSPYDIKHVYFRTIGEARKQYALLSFGRCVAGSSSGGQDTQHHDFELVLEVKGTWGRAVLIVLLIGVSLAAPRWIEILKPEPWVNGALQLLGALVAGALVVFGLRKVP